MPEELGSLLFSPQQAVPRRQWRNFPELCPLYPRAYPQRPVITFLFSLTRMESEGLSRAHTALQQRTPRCAALDGRGWAAEHSGLLPSSLMSSVPSQGPPSSQPCSASTAFSLMQQGFSCTVVDSWERGSLLTQPQGSGIGKGTSGTSPAVSITELASRTAPDPY